MKQKLLLLSMLQCVGFGLFAQQTTTPRTIELKPVKSQTTTSSGTTVSTSGQAQDSLAGETVEHLNSVIDAIDSKVAYVKTDEAESKKATEAGWFIMMARQREILVAKREVLIQRQNGTK